MFHEFYKKRSIKSKKKVTCFGYQDTRWKIETNAFHPQKLINMHIYDNQLYAKVEDLNV